MSTNLNLVRWLLSAWNRADFDSLAEALDPQIEILVADGPDPGPRIGVEPVLG